MEPTKNILTLDKKTLDDFANEKSLVRDDKYPQYIHDNSVALHYLVEEYLVDPEECSNVSIVKQGKEYSIPMNTEGQYDDSSQGEKNLTAHYRKLISGMTKEDSRPFYNTHSIFGSHDKILAHLKDEYTSTEMMVERGRMCALEDDEE